MSGRATFWARYKDKRIQEWFDKINQDKAGEGSTTRSSSHAPGQEVDSPGYNASLAAEDTIPDQEADVQKKTSENAIFAANAKGKSWITIGADEGSGKKGVHVQIDEETGQIINGLGWKDGKKDGVDKPATISEAIAELNAQSKA